MPAPSTIYFPQVARGGWADWVEVVNVGTEEANVTALARDQNGNAVWSVSKRIVSFQCWVVPVEGQANKKGVEVSLEVSVDQPIIGERHSHYQGGKTAIGQLAQVTEGRKPAPPAIYFPQIAAGGWGDWVIITNVSSHAKANLNALARDINGNFVWSGTKALEPYQCWIVPVDGTADKKGDVSLEVSSDHGVLGERHCHSGSQVLSFAGASPHLGSVGTRLFFPEIYSGAHDFFRFFNTGEADALISVVARDRNSARVIHQIQGRSTPQGFWTVPDESIKSVTGTLEVMSTQPIAGERHMHYQGGKTAISQLGQVIAL